MTAPSPMPSDSARPPAPPAPTANKLPGTAILGLAISMGLLLTAIGLEIHAHLTHAEITVRTPADVEHDAMLQPVPPGSALPTQAELNPPPHAVAPPLPPFVRPGMNHPGGPGDPPDMAAPGPENTGTPGAPETPEALIQRGGALVVKMKCITCHSIDGHPATSTTFLNIYGKQSQLKDGRSVTVDDAYIRESILDPQAKIVAGPTATMPSYQGVLSDSDIAAITAYIKTLKSGN